MRFIGLFFALALPFAGCSKDKPTGSGGQTPETPKKEYVCKADSECRVSCTVRGSCCGKGCVCDQAYHKEEYAEVVRDNAERCDGKHVRCDEYSCPESEPMIAKCEAGKCVAKAPQAKKTQGRMEGGFFVVDGAPPPNACKVAEDCLGNTVPAEGGCCNEPTQVVPHSKAYRKWLGQWRSKNCQSATCPPPPAPAKPADCLFEMACEAGVCKNSCGGRF